MTTTPTATISTDIAELGGVTGASIPAPEIFGYISSESADHINEFRAENMNNSMRLYIFPDERRGITMPVYLQPVAAPVAPEPAAVQKETQHQRDRRIISDALKKAKEDWTEMLAERSDRMDWFMSWFVKNYPADTVITDPNWHGPRILAAAEFALKSHPAPQPLAEVSAAQENNYHDAYRGARDDLQDWKRRALEAEHKLSVALGDVNGPTFMGEPAVSAAQAVPEGWQLVPINPTDEMIDNTAALDFEGEDDQNNAYRLIYRAMLAAAPPQPTDTTREA